MTYKKVLCVGLYDNGLSLLLKLLCKKKEAVKFVRSVGIDDHARKELSSSKSVIDIALELGFVIVYHKPIHPSITEDAKKSNLTVLYHQPTHISTIKNINLFDMIITPYRFVYDQLIGRRAMNAEKVHLICHPDGIDIATSFAQAYPLLRSWVDSHL
ncbi:MAG: hypothetical protein WC819_06470 [Parcubacteria group bacterium]|jgi:hypothetical protein